MAFLPMKICLVVAVVQSVSTGAHLPESTSACKVGAEDCEDDRTSLVQLHAQVLAGTQRAGGVGSEEERSSLAGAREEGETDLDLDENGTTGGDCCCKTTTGHLVADAAIEGLASEDGAGGIDVNPTCEEKNHLPTYAPKDAPGAKKNNVAHCNPSGIMKKKADNFDVLAGLIQQKIDNKLEEQRKAILEAITELENQYGVIIDTKTLEKMAFKAKVASFCSDESAASGATPAAKEADAGSEGAAEKAEAEAGDTQLLQLPAAPAGPAHKCSGKKWSCCAIGGQKKGKCAVNGKINTCMTGLWAPKTACDAA